MTRTCHLYAAILAVFLVVAWSDLSVGQGISHGKTEFAILPSLNFASGGGKTATIITFPSVSPAIRMTFWTRSPMTIDFGLSFVRISGAYNDDVTILWLDGGIGADLAGKQSSWRPFVTGLVGYISVSGHDTESDPYIGTQIGVRHFVRDYAATRMQVGYRKTLGDTIDLGNLEFAAGVSFFL